MRSKKYLFVAAVSIFSLADSVNAQMVVSDPPEEAETGTVITELGTADTELGTIETTLSSMLTMMTKPTGTVAGAAADLDAGTSAEAARDEAEFVPELKGVTPTSADSTTLLAQEKAAILEDQIKGLIKGDSALQQAERERLIGTNLQGVADSNLQNFARAEVAAKTIYGLLGSADIKDATVLDGVVGVEGLELLGLVGQSISTNTAAVGETFLSNWKRFFQYREDHLKTALTFKV